MLIDTHCHLDMLEDPNAALDRAQQAGVTRVFTIGTDLESSRSCVERADSDPRVFASVGLHPHDAKQATPEMWAEFEELARHPRCVGVGEAGLDYHYDNSPRDKQREVFARHIELAASSNRTLIIHTRDAWDDTFALLGEGPKVRTVFHCFSGGAQEAERALETGAVLSFSGIVTFKKADDIRAAALLTPADSLIVETDSPFLAPVPHRGKPNEPAHVAETVKYLAQLRGVEVVELVNSTSETTRRVFQLAD